MLELGSSKKFYSLGKCRDAQEYGDQDCVYRFFPHGSIPFSKNHTLL